MNEITKIHLGRQAFTIAVDAHKELQEYLRAIKKHMANSDDAVEEVELRMAELLAERGVHGDKVVLLKDVEYLKQQLGEPGDFGDEEAEDNREDSSAPKRLFRDTENAMVAGVAAGIGKYIGIDPVWIRLAFIAFVFAGGSGILAYVILWLIVPEAKTSSERLQMQGKPVTVDALKDVVERADVKGAANRAQRTIGKVVQPILKAILGVVGLGLMLAGIGTLLGLLTASTYWALNHDLVPARIFPVGANEVALIALVLLALAMLSLFLLIAGVSVMKRKWRLPGWGLGAIVAVFLVSVAIGGALAADAAPKVKQRYDASQHTYALKVPEFHKLQVRGAFDTSIRYEESNDYSVSLKYWGDADATNLKAEVTDGTLIVDSRSLAESMRCHKLCLFHSPVLGVVISGPKLQEVVTDMQGAQLNMPDLHDQTLKVDARGSSVFMPDITSDVVRAERLPDGGWNFTFSGTYNSASDPQDVAVFENTAIMSARNIDLTYQGECGVMREKDTGDHITINGTFGSLTVNGQLIGATNDLRKVYDEPGMSAAKCIDLELPDMPGGYYRPDWQDTSTDSL